MTTFNNSSEKQLYKQRLETTSETQSFQREEQNRKDGLCIYIGPPDKQLELGRVCVHSGYCGKELFTHPEIYMRCPVLQMYQPKETKT